MLLSHPLILSDNNIPTQDQESLNIGYDSKTQWFEVILKSKDYKVSPLISMWLFLSL